MPAYPAYQSFKTRADRAVYCSTNRVQNHAEGSAWMARCMAHYGIQQSDVLSTTTLNNQPAGNNVHLFP